MAAHQSRDTTPTTSHAAGWRSRLADDGTVHLRLRGEFDHDEADALGRDLLVLCRVGNRVALDLAEVRYFGARGLTALVTAAEEARRAGGALHIVVAAPIVHRLLQVTDLLWLLEPECSDVT